MKVNLIIGYFNGQSRCGLNNIYTIYSLLLLEPFSQRMAVFCDNN